MMFVMASKGPRRILGTLLALPRTLLAVATLGAIFGVAASVTLSAQERPSCATLKQYREVEAPRAWSRAALDYTLTPENWSSITAARAEALDDDSWGITDWSLLTATVASELTAECRLVGSLLRVDPATGAPTATPQAGTATGAALLKGLDTAGALSRLVGDAFSRAAAREYLNQIGPVGESLKELWQLAAEVRSASDRHASWRDTLRATVRGQLDRLDARLHAYDSAIAGSREKSLAMAALDSAVSAYCVRFGGVEAITGTWISTDSLRRFTIVIDGTGAIWRERRPEGGELVRSMPVSVEGGQFRLYRANDDSVLAFLGFKDALRAEIQAQHPEPSFLILAPNMADEKGADGLRAEWHGLIAVKDMKAKLKSLKQPRQVEGKVYILRRER